MLDGDDERLKAPRLVTPCAESEQGFLPNRTKDMPRKDFSPWIHDKACSTVDTGTGRSPIFCVRAIGKVCIYRQAAEPRSAFLRIAKLYCA